MRQSVEQKTKNDKVQYDIERMDPLAATKNPCLQLFYEQHLERYEEASNHLKRWIEKIPEKNLNVIIDAACGTGFGGKYLSRWGGYIGVDISDSALNCCRERYPDLKFHKLDLMQNDALSSFCPDVIVSFETLEHLPDPNRFLQHCYETLKNAKDTHNGLGRFICSAPIVKSRDYDRFHLYDGTQTEWRKSIREAGFQIEEELIHSFECPFSQFATSVPVENKEHATRVVNFVLSHPSYWFERIWWWGIKKKFRFATCSYVCKV